MIDGANEEDLPSLLPDDEEVPGSQQIDEEVDLEGIDLHTATEDEWFQPDIFYQPPMLATVHVSPGVSIRDVNTGKMRCCEMPRPEGRMSRLEYLGLTRPPEPPEQSNSASAQAEDRRPQTAEAGEAGQVAEIREQFQAPPK